jgi:uncharacterized membrane protein
MGWVRAEVVDRVDAVVDRLGRAERLDRVARPVAGAVGRARPGALVDLAAWVGQPLHPALTDLPIGFWTSAWVFDLIGGPPRRAVARTLVGLGVVSALPTVVTGLSDWAGTAGEARRIGFVHGAINSVGVVCYGASWLARRRGRYLAGVALGMVGATAATLAAYFGGHLVYRLGVGVREDSERSGLGVVAPG